MANKRQYRCEHCKEWFTPTQSNTLIRAYSEPSHQKYSNAIMQCDHCSVHNHVFAPAGVLELIAQTNGIEINEQEFADDSICEAFQQSENSMVVIPRRLNEADEELIEEFRQQLEDDVDEYIEAFRQQFKGDIDDDVHE